MPDHFAVFAQPRRPWLDPAALRESFQRAAARLHPDAGGGTGDFAALNTAHAILREPAARLRHLLELEAPHLLARAATIPPGLADHFMRLAPARRALAGLGEKLSATTSPLARALLAGEEAGLRRDLEGGLAGLTAALEAALAELRALDAAWVSPAAAEWDALAALQARFAFLAKWSAQLREDLFRLGG